MNTRAVGDVVEDALRKRVRLLEHHADASAQCDRIELLAVDVLAVGTVTCDDGHMSARNVNVWYGDIHAIDDVTLEIGRNQVVALIGPSGCGKSTFLRCLNRMNDSIDTARVTGEIPPDRPVPGSSSRSRTSLSNPARSRLRWTISSSSARFWARP